MQKVRVCAQRENEQRFVYGMHSVVVFFSFFIKMLQMVLRYQLLKCKIDLRHSMLILLVQYRFSGQCEHVRILRRTKYRYRKLI